MAYTEISNLIRFLREQKVKETGAFSKGVNKGLNIAISALSNPQICPVAASTPDSATYLDRNWVLAELDRIFSKTMDASTYLRQKLAEMPCKEGVLSLRCGQCRHAGNSATDCAYKCGNHLSPCHGRTTYADFGCLYGEPKEKE